METERKTVGIKGEIARGSNSVPLDIVTPKSTTTQRGMEFAEDRGHVGGRDRTPLKDEAEKRRVRKMLIT